MKGDRLYQLALKKALKDDVDLNEVFTLLVKAKKVNNYKAIYALATWYLFGKHVKKDVYEAFGLLLQAAEHNVRKPVSTWQFRTKRGWDAKRFN